MRWKNFIPFVIIVVAGTIIYLFFLDTILKFSIQNLGSSIAGAKVEVRKVHFDILKLSIDARDLRVGNKKDEWRNLFEAGKIKFAMNPGLLFERKFIIDEMTAEGVKWNTRRKTSCRIPEKKKKKEDGEEDTETDEVRTEKPSFFQTMLSKVDIKQIFDVNKISSVAGITSMKADVETKTAFWQKELAASDYKAQAEAIGKTVSEIKVGAGMSVEDARVALAKLNEAKVQLDSLTADYNTVKARFDSDYKTVSGYPARINDLKLLDIKKMIGEAKGGIEPQGIARSVFGPVWIDRTNSALFWVKKGRKMMPKKYKLKAPKRSKGIWIAFPGKRNMPVFLIKKLLLSGEAPNGVVFSGIITGITSSPPVLGEPIVADIKAWFPNINSEKTFANIRAVLDHTTSDAKDDFTVLARNFPIKEFRIGQSDVLPTTMHIGGADINMAFGLYEKELDSSINVDFNNVGFTSDAPPQTDLAKIAADALSNVGRISAKGRMYGPMSALKFEMSSSMDSILSQKFNEAVGKRLKEEEARIRAEIDRAVDAGKQDLQAKTDDFKKQAQSQIDAYKASLDAQAQLVQAKTDEVKKQGEAYVDQEKKKAEQELQKKGEELKNQAADKLKGLFGGK